MPSARDIALTNALKALTPSKALPANVFADEWDQYRFTASDWIMCEEFATAAKGFLAAEQAASACFINLDRFMDCSNAENTFYFDGRTDPADFAMRLRNGGGDAWMRTPSTYVCTSELYTWCIYCDEYADIAVIGLKGGSSRFRRALLEISAGDLAPLSSPGHEMAQDPFVIMDPLWRLALAKSYFCLLET